MTTELLLIIQVIILIIIIAILYYYNKTVIKRKEQFYEELQGLMDVYKNLYAKGEIKNFANKKSIEHIFACIAELKHEIRGIKKSNE